MRSIPAEDVQQSVNWILEHPFRAYFMIKGDSVKRMNRNAALMLSSCKGIFIGIFGVVICIFAVLWDCIRLVFDPISKLVWYVRFRGELRSGEFYAKEVEVKDDENE